MSGNCFQREAVMIMSNGIIQYDTTFWSSGLYNILLLVEKDTRSGLLKQAVNVERGLVPTLNIK